MAKRAAGKPDLSAQTRTAVLFGLELYTRSQHTETLKDALAEAHGDVDVVRFDGERTEAAEVLDECRSFGLMSAYKLVILDNADRALNADTRPLFERYAESPAEGATLLLRADKSIQSPKLTKLLDAAIECKPIADDYEAIRQVQAMATERHGVPIAKAAAERLVEQLGTDLARLDNELAKLATAAIGPKDDESAEPEITSDLLDDLAGAGRTFDPWTLQSVILTGDPEAAGRRIRAILDNSPKDATFPALMACSQLAEKLNGLSCGLEQGYRAGELSKPLKLWGDAARVMPAAAQALPPRVTRRIFAAALDADMGTRQGLGSADQVAERLTLRLTLALASARRR